MFQIVLSKLYIVSNLRKYILESKWLYVSEVINFSARDNKVKNLFAYPYLRLSLSLISTHYLPTDFYWLSVSSLLGKVSV